MDKKTGFDDAFGDDFEVSYTEEMPEIRLDLDEADEGGESPDGYGREYREYNDEYDDAYDEEYGDTYDNEYDEEYDEGDEYSEASNEYDIKKGNGHRKAASRRVSGARRPSELAAPIQNIVHTGSSLAQTLTRLIFRPAPVLMSAVILLITAYTYWTDSAAYGNILTVIEHPESSMVTFLAVGAVVVLWELCCFFFTLSGVWRGNGRGLSFFVLVYLLSYLSGLAGAVLPEGMTVIDGIRGGLLTYGSLYSMIFPFCVIGSVTCILQKILGR